jgi:hypothetical protein
MFNTGNLRKAVTAGTALAALAAMLPLAANAQAADKPGHLHQRIQNQQNRLQHGLKSGQLTQGEYNRDEARIKAVQQERHDAAAADGGVGKLSDAQRTRLNDQLGKSSRDIYFAKHNDRTQPGVAPHGTTQLNKLPDKNAPGYVGDRVQRQTDRIKNGVANGSLTRGEYQKDMTRLKGINAQREAWLKAQGGTLTDAQKSQLDQELNGDSSQIRDTRHNAKDQNPG